MDDDYFEKGLRMRKATLGAEFVEQYQASAYEFDERFQKAMTPRCRGIGWGDETSDPNTRSMMNHAMIGALGKTHEWEVHCRGALNNGVTKADIRSIFHVVAIYCGVPQALKRFRAARKALADARRALGAASNQARGKEHFWMHIPQAGVSKFSNFSVEYELPVKRSEDFSDCDLIGERQPDRNFCAKRGKLMNAWN